MLMNQKVEIQYSIDGTTWIAAVSCTTDSSGKFSVNWKPNMQNKFYLRGFFVGNTKYRTSTSAAILEQVTAPNANVPRFLGVNYLSLYYYYDTPDSILNRDFARFRSNGINVIALAVTWYRVETSKGVYDQKFIDNVIHIARVANQYGIKVMIDFHTLISDSDAWSNPQYVGAASKLIFDPGIASAYVSMVKWSVSKFKVLPNIWAYSVLNEPWFWPLDDWRRTNWINLIGNLSSAVKAIDKKPITVRFVAALFERDWQWNPRLLSALDFVSLNAYLSDDATDSIYWNTFDKYQSGLLQITKKAASLGKQAIITEFGYPTPNDTLQADKYKQYVTIFKSASNLVGWLSWGYDTAYDRSNPTWSSCGAYSVVDQSTGTTRPAYNILTQ